MLEASHRYFHHAADLFAIDPKLRSILLTPNRVVKAELAFEGADGEIHHYVGYRAQHSKKVVTAPDEADNARMINEVLGKALGQLGADDALLGTLAR